MEAAQTSRGINDIAAGEDVCLTNSGALSIIDGMHGISTVRHGSNSGASDAGRAKSEE